MNRPKAQGTSAESALVADLRARGFVAQRIAEGGSLDVGDVETWLNGRRVVIESKACQQLSAQACLSKARRKAGDAVPVVAWRRLTRKPGDVRRTPVAGERLTVFLAWDDLLDLMSGRAT